MSPLCSHFILYKTLPMFYYVLYRCSVCIAQKHLHSHTFSLPLLTLRGRENVVIHSGKLTHINGFHIQHDILCVCLSFHGQTSRHNT
jgi:hypothetical protein